MARILIQTNDCRTVFDERDVSLTEINGERSRNGLVERIGHAIREAEKGRYAGPPSVGGVLAVSPVRGYLELHD